MIPIVRYREPALVFIKRAHHLTRNPGQIGFPGGFVDASDGGDASVAALREFEEELGVAREHVRIVERLEDVVTVTLQVTVTPFVGIVDPPITYRHDANETASVHEVPLAALYEVGALHAGTERVARDGRQFSVHTWLFDYGDIHVWGATARMLREFVKRYERLEDVPLDEPIR